jgi:hypothetical protein
MLGTGQASNSLIMSEFEASDKVEALCEREIDSKFIKT